MVRAHTPTPWAYDYDYCQVEGSSEAITGADGSLIVEELGPDGVPLVDLPHIVECVNAMAPDGKVDALVRAARELVAENDEAFSRGEPLSCSTARLVEALAAFDKVYQ